MVVAAGPTSRFVRLLDVDPDLGHDVAPELLTWLRPRLTALAVDLPAGPWRPPLVEGDRRGHLGLLVVRGLLTRDVRLASTSCAELLGDGDLLRPWEGAEGGLPMALDVAWEVLVPTRLAVIDRQVTTLIGRVPELTTALVSRTVRRSRWLALHLAIRCLRRIDVRLLALFWHLADRWGRVTPEGVVVPLAFTHELLGRLVGARRPTVTTALGDLAHRDLVHRREDGGWLLGLELPEELARLNPAVASGLARPDGGVSPAGEGSAAVDGRSPDQARPDRPRSP